MHCIKNLLALFIFVFLASCIAFEEPVPSKDLTRWQKAYQFDKTEPYDIALPKPVGDSIVVGNGKPESITRKKIQKALDKGGYISFNTGGRPVTVYIDQTLAVKKHGTVLDGGGLVTLDARKERRIIFSVSSHSPINPARDQKMLNWVLKGFTLKNGKTSGGSLYEPVPNIEANDGSGNGDQSGCGAAVFSGLWNQCFIVSCRFFNNETMLTNENIEVGGAVFARGGYNSTLTIVDSYFENNRATIGGAVNSLLTNLTVIRCGFFRNRSTNHGGAIYTDGGASDGRPPVNPEGFVKIHASVFRDNVGATQGGGAFLFVYEGKILVTESIFENNICGNDFGRYGIGGGLRTGNGYTEINRCAFVNNQAYSQGGGLWIGENDNFKAKVENSIFYQNKALVPGSVEKGVGGALSAIGGELDVINCSIVDNQAHQAAGVDGSALVSFKNTILSDNRAFNPWNVHFNIQNSLNFHNLGGNIQWLTEDKGRQREIIKGIDALDPEVEKEINRTEGFTPIIRFKPGSSAKGQGVVEGAPVIDQHRKQRIGRNDIGSWQE
jgi:predicted outer membrane repeat protein